MILSAFSIEIRFFRFWLQNPFPFHNLSGNRNIQRSNNRNVVCVYAIKIFTEAKHGQFGLHC